MRIVIFLILLASFFLISCTNDARRLCGTWIEYQSPEELRSLSWSPPDTLHFLFNDTCFSLDYDRENFDWEELEYAYKLINRERANYEMNVPSALEARDSQNLVYYLLFETNFSQISWSTQTREVSILEYKNYNCLNYYKNRQQSKKIVYERFYTSLWGLE